MRRARTTTQRVLPGFAEVAKPRDTAPVTVPMREVSKGTDKAWHLAPMGVGSGAAGWAPRSEVTRGEGPAASLFTMPKWVAVERGWLK